MKKLIMIATENEDRLKIDTKVQGMTALDIIGVLELKKEDILKQLAKQISTDKEVKFIRKRVVEGK